MVAIGVGPDASVPQLTQLAGKNVLLASSYYNLQPLLATLVKQTCTTVSTNPCGTTCQGFCNCGSVCQCPTCNDNNACTVDTCNANINGAGCVYTAVNCNDGNACTTDTCDPVLGCQHTPAPACNDFDCCTSDACVPSIGCTYTPINCNNGNPCVKQGLCNPASGCDYSQPVTCNLCKFANQTLKPCPSAQQYDGDLCKIWSCDPSTGTCSYTERNCTTGNPCVASETCVSSTGNCTSTPKNCSDGNSCTDDFCSVSSSGCYSVPWNISRCDDLNACTNDSMNSAAPGCCVHTNITCPFIDYCATRKCYSYGGCKSTTIDCGTDPAFVNKVGNCQVALCDPKKIHVAGRTDGCYLSLLSGKTLNNCGYCKGSSSSPKSVNGVQCENAAITTAAAVGIGAAALAIIIVAVILCVFLTAGGVGGGMAYYRKHRGQMGNLGSNPLYVESNREGTNPLYDRS